MSSHRFEITVRCANMDDALDIYCKIIAQKTADRAEAILALKLNDGMKELSKDRLDRDERPQLHIVQ